MGRFGILFFLIFSVFSVLSLRESSIAAEVTVLPQELFPGDAFVLKVNDTKVSRLSPVSFKEKKFHFSRCGRRCFMAVGAVEMETKPGVYPVKLIIGRKRVHKNIVIKPIIFPTLELTLPEEQVFLSTENLKRAKEEERKLKSLFCKVSRRFWKGDFMLPLENEISSFFGTKRIFNEKRISFHRGLDIRGEEGEEVRASNRGRVMLAEGLFFGGNTIILDHGQGIHTLYMHLSEMNVRPGEIVSKGDVIGFVGSSGRSSGYHLHFGIKIMNTSINPLSLTELDM
jgi:hypothetical protein